MFPFNNGIQKEFNRAIFDQMPRKNQDEMLQQNEEIYFNK